MAANSAANVAAAPTPVPVPVSVPVPVRSGQSPWRTWLWTWLGWPRPPVRDRRLFFVNEQQFARLVQRGQPILLALMVPGYGRRHGAVGMSVWAGGW
jgi:hypothetical protein